MPDDTSTLVALVAILLLALSWHEAAHAWVADRLGDPTARRLGRVSLNPLRHLDPFLSVLLPVLLYNTTGVAIGGGKPVPIDPRYFKKPTRDFMFVALAGPFSNLLLALLFSIGFVLAIWSGLVPSGVVENPYGADVHSAPRLNDQPASFAAMCLAKGITLNVGLAAFNLIPIPPLDGSRFIGWLLPRALQRFWYALDRVGILIVLAFIFVFDGTSYVSPAIHHLMALCDEGLQWLVRLRPTT